MIEFILLWGLSGFLASGIFYGDLCKEFGYVDYSDSRFCVGLGIGGPCALGAALFLALVEWKITFKIPFTGVNK